jgi:GxxExxY protein
MCAPFVYSYQHSLTNYDGGAGAQSPGDRPGLVDDGLDELTWRVIGPAMAVHNDLGPGHREATYHIARTQRLSDTGRAAEREPELPIADENGNVANSYVADHWVEQGPLVEYKAHNYALANDGIAQCIDYFAASECRVLLLFNFGRPRLEWQRLFPPQQILDHRRKRWTRPGHRNGRSWRGPVPRSSASSLRQFLELGLHLDNRNRGHPLGSETQEFPDHPIG